MARDFTCATVLLAIAVGYYTLASGIGRSALADEVGPAGLPLVYAALLAALAAALAIKTVFRYVLARRGSARVPGPSPGFVLARAAGTLGIGAGYVLLVTVLGYWLSLALLLPAMAVYQGKRPDARLGLIAIGGATSFWLLFVWLLGIPMPRPWLPPFS
jgi:putative tricarboxylic transport membrane protein